jgi:predicted HTH domain antitoxin
MPLLIEDQELEEIHLSEQEMRLEIALMLYQQRRLSMGKASKFANMNRVLFQRILGERAITINFDEEDLNEDLETLGITLR